VTGGLGLDLRMTGGLGLTGGLEHCLAGHLVTGGLEVLFVTGGLGWCCSIDVTGGLWLVYQVSSPLDT
jgi:hypothetical protein